MAWLSALALVWILVEPSKRSGEMLHNARTRVAAAIVGDPVFWLLIVISVVSLVRFLNDGIRMAYDVENIRWYMAEPAFPFLPGSVSGAGALPFMTVVAMIVLSVGLRHALGRSARISFLALSSFFAGVAGFVAVGMAMCGNPAMVSATLCKTSVSSFAGSAFGMYALAAVASLAGSAELKWSGLKPVLIVALGGSLAGLWFFAPPFAVLVFLVAAIAVWIVSMVYLAFAASVLEAVKMSAVVLIASMIAFLLCFAAVPEGVNESRLAMLAGFDAMFPAKFFETRKALASIAMKVWRENPWAGSGLGSFPIAIRFNATYEDWLLLKVSQPSALNGWWTFLAERGLVGALSAITVLVFLAVSFVRRLVHGSLRRTFVPFIALAVAAVAALAAETCFDEAVSRSDVLLAAFSFLCLSVWAFPPKKQN